MSIQPPPFRHPSFRGLIGVARRDITPPVGIYARNWGAAKHDVATGIHRPLTATALVISEQDRRSPLILVALDLCTLFFPETAKRLREEILTATPTDSSRLMINLGHTHSGGPILLDPSMKDFPGGEHIAPYIEKISAAVQEAVSEARDGQKEATLEWSVGRCDLATNRDLSDPDGTGVLCGYNPNGEADDTLLVGRVSDAKGRPVATIVNYACHPTTLAWENDLVSPDYVGALRETVETHTGGAPTLFLQGSSGDLAPREQYSGDPALADRHGRQLGYAALSTLEGMLPPNTRYEYDGVVESGADLATWKYTPHEPSTSIRAHEIEVELPLKEDWPTSEELCQQLQACEDRVQAERLRRKLVIRSWLGESSAFPMPVWVWKIGDAILIGHHTETYSQLQTELRARFPERTLIVMNLVNGTIGYQPPEPVYDREVYQVWQTPLARGAFEELVRAYDTAIRSVTETQVEP